jgi:cyclophilin family peptidyl-prolyl cis-trans isomerase
MRPFRIPVLLAVLALAGCGGSTKKPAKPVRTAAPAASQAPTTGCKQVPAQKSKGVQNLAKPKLKLDPKKTYTATVTTSCGTFRMALDVKRAPKTSASFVYLAKQGFFDHTSFQRVVPGFVIQGGDPLGNGTGGPGYTVVEPPPAKLRYTRGVVAMAKGGNDPAGASGSQFFVVTGEDAGLPPQYALLGKVSSGQSVVDTIGSVATDQTTESPTDPIAIDSVTIKEQ